MRIDKARLHEWTWVTAALSAGSLAWAPPTVCAGDDRDHDGAARSVSQNPAPPPQISVETTTVDAPRLAPVPEAAARAPNLVQNGSFEEGHGAFPAGWRQLDEDTTYPWRRQSYLVPDVGPHRASVWERGNAVAGTRSLRCAAAPGQVSGVTQRIFLNQQEPRDIELGAWCKTENVNEDSWCDLCLVIVRHVDGTYHQVSFNEPFIALGKQAHDWEYRSRTFAPDKPIRYVDLKAAVRGHVGLINPGKAGGADRTGLLWLDGVYLGEVGSSVAGLTARGVAVPVPTVAAFPSDCRIRRVPNRFAGGTFVLSYGEDAITFEFDGPDTEAGPFELLLATHERLAFDNEKVESFYRATLPTRGDARLERAYARAGRGLAPRDVVHFQEVPAGDRVRYTRDARNGLHVTTEIPYTLLRREEPEPGEVWRFNIVGRTGTKTHRFAPGETDYREFARLEFNDPPTIEITPTRFGERKLPDSNRNAWIARTEAYWGENTLGLKLRSNRARTVTVRVNGTHVRSAVARINLQARRTALVVLPYRAEREGLLDLVVDVRDDHGTPLARECYPVSVPPAIDLWPGWRYFYPDEASATIRGRVHIRGSGRDTPLTLRLLDRTSGAEVMRRRIRATDHKFETAVDISGLRVHADPVADYECTVSSSLGALAQFPFGRLKKPSFEPLSPIRTVDIDDDGMMLVNGERFFPIVASLHVKDLRAGHAESSGLGCNVSKHNIHPWLDDPMELFDYTWSLNTYIVPCCLALEPDKAEETLLPLVRDHPAFLFSLGAEVYRNVTPIDVYQRLRKAGRRPVLYEYYNCGGWYDTLLQGAQGGDIAMFPTVVRKAPLARLVSRKIGLEIAAADRPRSVLVSIPFSIHRDTPAESVRCAIYLAVVNRANGVYLYMYDTADSDGRQIKLARGFVLELRRLSDMLVAPPTKQTITVRPADSGVETLERVHDGRRYLIAVNPTRSERTVRFTSPVFTADTRARVRFEVSRPLPIAEGAFSDTFPAFTARVYEIE